LAKIKEKEDLFKNGNQQKEE